MKTILLVDDEFEITETLQAILEAEGYQIATCANGEEALEYLQRQKPDLILLDYMMPILSGIEVLKRIRHEADLYDLPVILMSAVNPSDVPNEILWQTFLRKPFTLNQLLNNVSRHIGAP